DINAGVAKSFRRKNRYADEPRRALIARHQKRPRRHLGCIEFAIAQHAPKGLLDAEWQIGEIHALDFNATVLQRPRTVVIPTSQGQPDPCHTLLLLSLRDASCFF